MPRGNGTGPMGGGPMTGWGRGNCRGPASTDDFRGGAGGRGSGRGRGFGAGGGGRGWRNWFRNAGEPGWMSGRRGGAILDGGGSLAEADRQNLELRSVALESELESIKQQLSEFSDSSPTAE